MASPQQPSDVQVQPNSTGQAIETALVVQAGTGITVGRQVVALGDPNSGAFITSVTPQGQLSVNNTSASLEIDLQIAILVQLRINNALIVSAFNLHDDLVKLESNLLAAARNQLSGAPP